MTNAALQEAESTMNEYENLTKVLP